VWQVTEADQLTGLKESGTNKIYCSMPLFLGPAERPVIHEQVFNASYETFPKNNRGILAGTRESRRAEPEPVPSLSRESMDMFMSLFGDPNSLQFTDMNPLVSAE
jgi:hypothetical protein